MLAYAEFTLGEAKKLLKREAPDFPVRAVVKLLGEAGAYYRILGKAEAASNVLEQSLALIEEHQLGLRYWAVHTLRMGEVLRLKRDFLSAEVAFKAVLEITERHPDLSELKDFCLQHLGKLAFTQGDTTRARKIFEETLEIRKLKGDQELINSTEFALRVLKMKQPINRYKR